MVYAATGLGLRLLGPFELTADGRPFDLGGHRQGVLLAMLALDRNHVVGVDALVEEIWCGRPPNEARGNLQGVVSRARRVLTRHAPGAATIVARGAGYVLETDALSDAELFEQLLEAARVRVAGGDPNGAAQVLGAALELWRGPALADLADREFAQAPTARLDRMRIEAGEMSADALLAAGRPAEAAAVAQSLLDAEPFREATARRLMLALYRSGRQADALAVYTRTRAGLQSELGLDPGPELRALETRILAQDPDLVPVSTRPVCGPHNLPYRADRFLGRVVEVAELQGLAKRNRLLTLWGPGGAGKTRLALELGARLVADFPDGVWFVELSPMARGEAVASATMAGLGMLAGRDAGDPVGDLCRYLTNRQTLLILDNCEHVSAAVADLVQAVLGQCPDVHLVATSRELLNVAGERAWPVPSLSVPADAADMSQVCAADAVRLFAERAAAAQPGFTVNDANAAGVVEICRRLDGIPLAIELAAARVRMLGVQGLRVRLDDRFEVLTSGPRGAQRRHQTLRAAVDWSYELMPHGEQDMLNRLSVLPGVFDLDTVAAVAARDGRAAGFDALDLLGRLVDKSLVATVDEPDGTVRYRTLETIRQYAAGKLADAYQTTATQRRLLDHMLTLPFVDWARRWQFDFAWKREIHRNHDNLRAALEWAIAQGDAEAALALTGGMWNFWLWSETAGAGQVMERVLALPGRAPSTGLAETLLGLTFFTGEARHAREGIAVAEHLGPGPFLTMMRFFAGCTGDLTADPTLSAHLEIGVREADDTGATFAGAWCRYQLAWRALFAADGATALEHIDRAVAAAPPAAVEPFVGAHFLGTAAMAHAAHGDGRRAMALAEEVLAITRSTLPLPSLWAMGLSRALGAAALTGHHRRALEVADEQLQLLRRLGTDRWVGETLEFLALALDGCGRTAAARAVLGAAEEHRRLLREPPGSALQAVVDALAQCRNRLGPAPGADADRGTEERILLALRELRDAGRR